MLFYIDIEGVVQAAIPDTVTQGTVGVKEIIIIAPFPSSTVVTAFITLPNGIMTYPEYVGRTELENGDYGYKFTPITAFEGKIPAPDGVTVNVWKRTLDRALTQQAGTVNFTFAFTDQFGNTLTSTQTTMNLGKATPFFQPTVTEQDLNTIAAYLSAAQIAAGNAAESATNAQNAASEAEESATNAAESAQSASESRSEASALANAARIFAEGARGFAERAEQAEGRINSELVYVAYSIASSVNTANYELTIELKNEVGATISTTRVDLPLEEMVIDAELSEDGEKLILNLKNGNTVEIPISDILSGVATEDWVRAQISSAIADLATKQELDDTKTDIETDINNRLLNYSTTAESDAKYATKVELGEKADKVYVDEQIDNIEYMLSQFGVISPQEFAGAASVVPVPARSAKYAFLKEIGGMTHKWEGITYSTVQGQPYDCTLYRGTLPVGTYAVEGYRDFLGVRLNDVENILDSANNTFTVSSATDDILVFQENQSASETGTFTIYPYLVKIEGDTRTPMAFPGAWFGLRDTKPTAVTVNGANLVQPVTYPIPTEITSLEGYGKGVGNYSNAYNFETGQYTKRCVTYTFDGSENWQAAGARYYLIADYTPLTVPCIKDVGLCSDFNLVPYDDRGTSPAGSWCINSNGAIQFITDGSYSITTWKAYLAEHPVTILYVVAEPVYSSVVVDFDPLLAVEPGGSIEIDTDTGDSAYIGVEFQIINQGGTVNE